MDININQYWRDQANKKYARNHPEVPVRKAALTYLGKKEALSEEWNRETERTVFNEFVEQVRGILKVGEAK